MWVLSVLKVWDGSTLLKNKPIAVVLTGIES